MDERQAALSSLDVGASLSRRHTVKHVTNPAAQWQHPLHQRVSPRPNPGKQRETTMPAARRPGAPWVNVPNLQGDGATETAKPWKPLNDIDDLPSPTTTPAILGQNFHHCRLHRQQNAQKV